MSGRARRAVGGDADRTTRHERAEDHQRRDQLGTLHE
jgi:hypothetical protein